MKKYLLTLVAIVAVVFAFAATANAGMWTKLIVFGQTHTVNSTVHVYAVVNAPSDVALSCTDGTQTFTESASIPATTVVVFATPSFSSTCTVALSDSLTGRTIESVSFSVT